MSAPADRVLGWDLLRGVCALVVAFYHLGEWLGLARLPALGTYGVYLFFVLSGASLAYVYAGRPFEGRGDVARFLAVRWLRLAPLYVLLCALHALMLFLQQRADAGAVAWRLLLNASFTFGLHDPAVTALSIGGWSLGIEFIYYAAFPLLVLVLPRRRASLVLLAVLVAVQAGWIAATVGAQGWSGASVSYHQAPAFAAYFFGGCLLGRWQLRHPVSGGAWLAGTAMLAWVALLLVLTTPQAGDELLGARGAVLFLACFATVHLCGRARLRGRLAALARWCGDTTYGTYLLHPVLFFVFARFVAVRLTGLEVTAWPAPARWLLLAGVICAALGAAVLSERWLEAPIRRWGRRRLRPTQPRPAPPLQSEAASISS